MYTALTCDGRLGCVTCVHANMVKERRWKFQSFSGKNKASRQCHLHLDSVTSDSYVFCIYLKCGWVSSIQQKQ